MGKQTVVKKNAFCSTIWKDLQDILLNKKRYKIVCIIRYLFMRQKGYVRICFYLQRKLSDKALERSEIHGLSGETGWEVSGWGTGKSKTFYLPLF